MAAPFSRQRHMPDVSDNRSVVDPALRVWGRTPAGDLVHHADRDVREYECRSIMIGQKGAISFSAN